MDSKFEMIIEKIQKVTQTVLAYGITLAAFILFYMLILKHNLGVEKDIIIFILGAVSSNLTQIISYYFGSSKGSDEKSKTIDSLTQEDGK
jgi:hypothetical protein